MAKADRSRYVCTACGAASPKWAGQCGDCGAWNTLEETPVISAGPRRSVSGGYAGSVTEVYALEDIPVNAETRISTRMAELDRVLGGGIVPGSVIMIGGDPGIGKSTLLLQALAAVSAGSSALYITGEESLQQVRLRAGRLGLEASPMKLVAETNVERILDLLGRERPEVLVIDSIQTVFTETMQSAPGSVGQLRESTGLLVRYAKQSGSALFIVGHVTKEGTLAGPRVLEHMVDTVLYFEGDTSSQYRVLRAIKNRFGAINELGVFAMLEGGLKVVTNPSAIFLSRHPEPIPGSAVLVTREGSRPMLVEVQSLVDDSHLANPRRVTLGLEQNRTAMLLAVLHRHGQVTTYDQDVFVNVVGGIRVTETGADLAVISSILSSLRNRPLAQGLVMFGEVGLAGEVRPVQGGLDRLREAAKHGFTRAVVPAANAPKQKKMDDMEIIPVQRLGEALEVIW